jgi:3-oxoacyl-[acyl-carrier protein] reductase
MEGHHPGQTGVNGMDLQLRGKRALVTGASRGLGMAIAEALAAEGCDLVLHARDPERLRTLEGTLHQRYEVSVSTQTGDLALPADQERLADFAGTPDIVVNNAGANPAGEIDEISEEVWRSSWDLKLFGYIALTRAFYARMKAAGGGGVIQNVIGVSGERMNARYILGSAGNSALMALTRALGGRSPDFGVRVLGVNPGLTATDRATTMLQSWSQQRFGTADRAQEVLDGMRLPFGRMGRPEEVADLVAFLVSPRAGYMSGTVVTIDGGAANREA